MAGRGALTFFLRRGLPLLAIAALLFATWRFAEEGAGDASTPAVVYRWMPIAATLSLAVLVLAILQRLWRLRRDIHADAPGARLAQRLLRVLILLALPATLVVYVFALRFIDATVDNWFNVRLEQALDDALELGRVVVDQDLRRADAACTDLVDRLAAEPADRAQAIVDETIDRLGAIQLAVFAADGRVAALASSDPRWLDAPIPDDSVRMRLAADGRYGAAEPLGEDVVLRVLLPVRRHGAPLGEQTLQALFPLPATVAPLTRRIEAASFDFQRLKFLRGSLKLTFALVLTFVLLLAVLALALAAFGIARRLVAPIGRLAAATRMVAAGRFDAPLPPASDDEFGFLVGSFARMTRELEFAGARARRNARETEQQRAWLEAVLERLSSGVLGFDGEGRLRFVNPAAETILGLPLLRSLGHTLVELRATQPAAAPLADPLARHLADPLREWREEIGLDTPLGRRTLMLRGAALPEGAGHVVVFDDLTVLNRAQRDAAWGEVARRLAHEVKNPLTPIQLAAERLRRRFLGRLPDEDADLIDRATRTIVSQVEALKTMVNEFGDYARPVQRQTQPIALHALLDEVLDLYENDQRIALARDYGAGDPRVQGDAVRLRQALHNLIKNALEAIGDAVKPQIRISTRLLRQHDAPWVELQIADNGPGLPEGFDERWFEPYASSKNRGTGIGLAVVKKTAEEHGGDVLARTGEHGGAVFTIRLPLVAG